MSNLFKAGFVSFDQGEARIIDSNELANKKIEAFQEQELKRQRAQMASEEGFQEGEEPVDFIPGLEMEQLNQLTEDQGVIEPMQSPDPQFDMEAMQAEIDFKIQQAQEQADAIIQEANEQADAIRNNAIDQGRREGYDAGYQEGVAAAES